MRGFHYPGVGVLQLKREQRCLEHSFAFKAIASYLNILPTGFVVPFVEDNLKKSGTANVIIADHIEKLNKRGAVDEALKQNNQDTIGYMSVYDKKHNTVGFFSKLHY